MSAADPLHRNKKVTLKSDVQELLEKLGTTPVTLKHSDNHPKQRSRKPDEVSNRTRSKTGNVDQSVGDRTRSKVHALSFSRIQDNFFPSYDAMNFEDKRKE
jgi:hypothetical protein